MLPATVRLFFAVEVLCLLVYWELCLGVNARAYHKRDLKRHNETSHEQRDRTYTQKKPRSAQYGLVPQYQPVYSRQNIPVRLASVPASPLRVPVTGIRRLSNVGSFPALQRAYIPVVASLPGVQYPTVLQQNGVGGRYVIPYGLNMPSSRASSAGSESQMFDKHYNEKYNTLPTVSNADMDQDAPSLRRKLEDKKLDLGDDFDHFLDSLDGPCSKNPCKNGAKCRISHEGSSFFCICKKGFKGKTCEDKNPCFPNPCDNDGQCTLTSEGFECSCPKGFKGKKCEQENKCEPNPCENGGFCNELKNGEFECTCKRGFFGEKCQVTKKGCEPNPCLNEGRCSEQDDGSYKCTCMEGYTGRTCERSENKCLVNPCKNGGSCLPAMTSLGYECSCLHGFRGPNCEDHTGCDLNSCQNGGTCYETEFGVRCICKNGYSGDKCQVRKFCEADTCQNNGRCIEHANGFRCMCSEGYKGKTCEEMDRCRPNPCLHGGECVQSDSGYLCKCTSQYQGENCEVQNPCFENPCKNGGKCLGGLTGEYQCQCSDGYLGKNCEERNACQPNPCENSGVCRKNGDDFICECEEGYRGKRCENNDPCRINPCQNGGSCQRNGDNDYTCSCPEDFKGLHCEARKPCHPNPCLNDGTCEENDGDFTCSCKRGFRGKNCEELDRCEPSPCKNGGRCTPLSNSNTGKGFTCECINSFYGDTCEERNPCNPNPCANNGLCADVNGGFTCQCTAGFKGDRCHEIDKCAPNPCKHSGTCTEVIGGLGYACRCAYGYKGQDCEQKDHCHPNPCDHDGQCVPLDNEYGFKCKCSYGFRGQRCSDVNPCEPNPCHHESQCIALPGFGPSHICNCSTGWSGETCQKREICQPNPCQYGTKCVETGDDSYSCVKSMCHPNPCQNSGKCINVNEDDYQCACTDDYEGRRCEGDDKTTDLHRATTNDDEDWVRSLNTKHGNKSKMTNIDNLLKLIDKTLNAYNAKHSTVKLKTTKNKVDQVTTLHKKLKNYQNNHVLTKQPDNDNKLDTSTDDDSTTYLDNATKRQNVTDKTNDENVPTTPDENSDLSEIVKSINPDGGVVVEKPLLPTIPPEPPPNNKADRRDKPKTQTDLKQTKLEDSIIDEIHDEEAFIKSINPEGQVVVKPDKKVPRHRSSQLSQVPNPPVNIYSRPSAISNRIPNPRTQLVTSSSQVTAAANAFVKSGRPPTIPMTAIASCSPFLCQNGGVCVQEEGKPIRCKCKASFTGETCEINKCTKNPCRNGGMCLAVEREPGFVCKCRDGLTGPLCSRKQCEPNPCKNGGDCVMFYSVYLCKCKPGFEGKHCEGDWEHDKYTQFPLHEDEINRKQQNINSNSNNYNINNDKKNNNHDNDRATNTNGIDQQFQETKVKTPNSANVPTTMNGNQAYAIVPDEGRSEQGENVLLLADKKTKENEETVGSGTTTFRAKTLGKSEHDFSSHSKLPLYQQEDVNNIKDEPHFSGSSRKETPTRIESTITNDDTTTINEDYHTMLPLKDATKSTNDDGQSLRQSLQNKGFHSMSQLGPASDPNMMEALDSLTDDVLPITGSLSPKTAVVETEAKAKAQTSLDTKTNPGNRVSACYPSPCENGARCVESTDGEFQCICSQDFSGPRCEDKGIYKYSSAPKFFPGENEECKHCDKNARCVNGHCICRNKYVGDGLECWEQTHRDKEWSCDRNPCQNGGTCKPGIARCVCRLGYVGDYCEEYSPPVVRLTFDKLVEGNKLLDDSGNENDAVVLNGFQIAPKQGKCDNAGNLLGGDILFDGQNFKGIPRRAITIAAWVKVSTPLGIQSIFDTIGSHSEHRDGQYHFEIDNGRVRWFHRNEQGKTVFSVVTDQPVVNGSNWVLVTGTYSSKKNRARIFVNGDMIKEEKAHGMLLSGDWGAKAGIATLTELDVPDTNEDNSNIEDLSDNSNDNDKHNVINEDDLSNGYSDNENNLKRMNNELHILTNPDKDFINVENMQEGDNKDNRIKSIITDENSLTNNENDESTNEINNNYNINNNNNNNIVNHEYNNIEDDNTMNTNEFKRDGISSYRKHKHRYGARVLRGMVDEFSIFPSELSRLQILVLMKHCKVYYKRFTQSSKTTSTNQFQESFTEMKSYTPAAGDTSQSAVPYTPSYYQDTSSQRLPTTKWQYQGYTSASPRPLESTNHPSVNYQPASNTRTPVQTYSHSGYYGNTIKQNYQANTGQYQQASIGGARQTGYQRTQTLRQPYVSPHTPGLSSTIGPTPPRNKRPKIINGPFVPKYLHEAPSTATQEGYQRTPLAPAVSTYDPGPSYRAMPAQVGYITTQTPRGPIMNQNVPLVPQTRNQEQMGTVRTQAPRVPTITPSVPATYEYPSVRNLYQSQAKPNTSPYNAYTALPGQQPSANYQTAQSSWAVPDNGQRDVTSFGTASQARGNINNVQNTPQVAPPPYQTARTSATGTRYSTIPQTDSGVQYRTAQNVGTNWGGQYQSISSTGSEFASQYGPVQTLDNTPSYQPEAKGYIPGNNYQSRFEKPWQQNTDQITSANADVRSTSYTNSWPGRTQNGYTTSNVYSNQVNNYQNDANKRYRPASYFNANNLDSASPSLQSGVSGIGFPSSSYTTSSTSAYGASMNSYPTPSNMNFYNGARRQKIPKPLSQSAKKTLQSKPVYSQSLPAKVGNKQGQLNGPTYKNNNKQYNPASSKQLDNNGQYPSDVRQYQNNILKSSVQAKSSTATPDRPLTTTSGTTGANIGSPTPTVQQTGYTRDRSGWWTGTRTQAATGQWDANVVPSAKVDDAVMYSKGVDTQTSQTATPTATNTATQRVPLTKSIDVDKLVQRAFADFFTTHISRKKKKRKKRQDVHNGN